MWQSVQTKASAPVDSRIRNRKAENKMRPFPVPLLPCLMILKTPPSIFCMMFLLNI
jgi:hypothetical protein